MSHSGKQSKLGAIMLGSCMLLGISTASIAETQLTVENDGLALTAIVSSSKDILSTSIRVVGPDGFVFEDRFEDSTLQWIPEGDLADGRYHWETWTVTVTPGAPMRQINAPQAPAPNLRRRGRRRKQRHFSRSRTARHRNPDRALLRGGRQARAYRIRQLRSPRRLDGGAQPG